MPAGWSATTLAPQMWHTTAINDTGSVMVAGAIIGPLALSRDGGTTWADASVGSGAWISAKTSADGTRMVAVQFGGGMFLSSDTGATWTQVTGAPYEGRSYESVTMSGTGTRICAAIRADNGLPGQLFCSANGGSTFTEATLGGAPLHDPILRAVASSADGSVVVAASGDYAPAQGGSVYISTNGGTSFTRASITVGGAPATSGFYRAAVSADGNTIVVVGNNEYANPSQGIFVSHDRGATWTLGYTEALNFTSVSVSATGNVILATASDSNGARIVQSTNGGATFSAVSNPPGGETNWRSISINPTATRAIAATGTFIQTNGNVYRFSGSLGTP